jgi:hypothetical protein
LIDFEAQKRRPFAMPRITEMLLALAFSVLLANAAAAQNVTVNGRPIVANPRQQINSAQTNRVFGGLNIAVHSVPPAGQPAFLAGNPVVVQQINVALQANQHSGPQSPNLPTLPQPSQTAGNYLGGASLLETQVSIVPGIAPNVSVRRLSPAEFNRLFGGLNQAVPTPATIPAIPPSR